MIEVLLLVGAMTQHVDMKVGERLVVRVEDISTTGYRWHLDRPEGPVLAYEGSSLVAGAAPGGAGERRFAFAAASPGRAVIRLRLRRGWESEAAPLREGEVDVVVAP
jgi:predicted secreted protein